MGLEQKVYEYIETNKQKFIDASDKLWDFAELQFVEHQSAALLSGLLEEAGFQVERGLADMPTCFVATYGQGKPVIGILGEFDALTGLSQVADLPEKKELVPGGAGHGCGHNAFGSGTVYAAIAVKHFMQEQGLQGTIKYFGCPAEEVGGGKAFMVRAGLFDGVDAAMTWHPWSYNGYLRTGSLANVNINVKFHGIGAHAGATPHLGRSALDAVELTNVGVNYLREHIVPGARVHYSYLNAGGKNPNVVQPEAEASYIIRAPKMSQVEDILERVKKIIQGASLMTETTFDYQVVAMYSDYLANKTICDCFYRHLQEVIPQTVYTDEEKAYAHKFKMTVPPSQLDTFRDQLKELTEGYPEYDVDALFNEKDIMDIIAPSIHMYASSDVGNVSWVVPTSHFGIVMDAVGTPAHSWQRVAQGKSSIAHKGMLNATKVLAMSCLDFFENPALVDQAKADWEKELGGRTYKSLLDDNLKPQPRT